MKQMTITPTGERVAMVICDYCETEIDREDVKKSTIRVDSAEGYKERHVCDACAEILYDSYNQHFYENLI